MSVRDTALEAARACLSLESFEAPELLVPSAWLEHAPFAFWLIHKCRPKVVVELGTHHGFSYLAFCQAVKKNNFKTQCISIDTWQGDEHSGYYGQSVFSNLRAYHDPRYGSFSNLVRSTFDDAVGQFKDKSIDILHIDGRHNYDDVKRDFLSWRSKLSNTSIVLFHDTQVFERNFGVYRFWNEIREQHQHFEFTHGNGLGIAAIGQTQFAGLRPLFAASNDRDALAAIRLVYARLGSAISDRWLVIQSNAPKPDKRNEI